MNKKKFDPFKNLQLDPYEKELNDSIERGEFKPVKNAKAEIARITKIFQEATKKDKRVNIRVNSRDLDSIRAKAGENMLPYQTLISTVLHHFATGKIRIEL